MSYGYFAYEENPTGNLSPVIYRNPFTQFTKDGRVKSVNGIGRRVKRVTPLNPRTQFLSMGELQRLYPLAETEQAA